MAQDSGQMMYARRDLDALHIFFLGLEHSFANSASLPFRTILMLLSIEKMK
jgi:hypothetical protein